MLRVRTLLLLGAMAAALLISRPAFAHHSMTMYDRDHETTFKATIVDFDWANPHSQITFTAADDHGNTVKWIAEGPGPNRLANRGWSKDSLKPGDEVTVVGNRNKNGTPTMRFEKVILANGRELVAFPRGY
jgi:hypothetical protein